MSFHRVFPLLFVAACVAMGSIGQQVACADDSHDAHQSEGDDAHHEEADHDGGKPNPLAIDIDLAIWTGVIFAVLLFVLGKTAWPQIASALDEREKRIEGNIADAASKHDEAKQLLAEHEAKLARAADEVRELMEEARRDAEHTKGQIIAEAKQASDQERDRALRDVQRAADTALKTLAESSANLAVDLAGKVVKQNISADQQAQLVRDALSTLAASSPSKN
ncbi:MAG: F0F1 ATP synthase subunit B [Planctomycetes bacterium]|nr:F0F1 ATP synthase subunit B [Planctomycetota bacterium]